MKMALKYWSIIAAAIFAFLNLGSAQPSVVSSGNQMVIFWPASIKNPVLQSATNLNTPNWVTASDGVPVTAFTVLKSSPLRFFRLVAAPPTGMAFIQEGEFTMGDTLDGETDAVPVNVTLSAYYMETNLVSYGQWQTVYNFATNNGYTFVHPGYGRKSNQPVEEVDWYDAAKWCNARSQQAGLSPVYYTDAGLSQVFKSGEIDPYANLTASGYRLPTEAEWERAARGGLSGLRFPWGNLANENLCNYLANTSQFNYDLGPNGYNTTFSTNPPPYTSTVGYFPANPFGLCDMAGNVDEWCWDWYGTPYAGGNNPQGPSSGPYRVTRGGDWTSSAYWLRCACRRGYPQNSPSTSVGFRCVLGL